MKSPKSNRIIRRGDLIQRKPGTPWYLEARIKPGPGQKSQRHRISTTCTDYDDAVRVGADLKNQLLSGVHKWRVAVPTFAEWWATYAAKGSALATATVRNKAEAGQVLIRAFGSKSLTQITDKDCQAFRDWMTREGYKAWTIRNRCSQMRAAMKAAIRAKLITDNPWDGIGMPKTTKRTRVISTEEEAMMLHRMGVESESTVWSRDAAELRRFFQIALGTALRNGTICAITKAHVQQMIAQTVRVHEKEYGFFDIVTKGRQGHRVYVLPHVRTALVEQAEQLTKPTAKLFDATPDCMYKRVMALRERAGVPHFTVHDLRRTAATRLAIGDTANGIDPMPIPLLQAMTGHKRVETLVGFYTAAPDANVVEALVRSATLLGAVGTASGTPS